MQEGHSTATEAMRARGFGAGLGLPNIQRNADEFKVTSEVGVGTTLRYAVYTTPHPREG
jgi:anti-sigma regulatory factor (Ser/Thr protein kinase)